MFPLRFLSYSIEHLLMHSMAENMSTTASVGRSWSDERYDLMTNIGQMWGRLWESNHERQTVLVYVHWNSITLIWFRMINPPVFFSFTRVIEFWLCLSGPKWTSTWQKWYANLTQFSELLRESACGRMWSRYCLKKTFYPLCLQMWFEQSQ